MSRFLASRALPAAALIVLLLAAAAAYASVQGYDLTRVWDVESPQAAHVEQQTFDALVTTGSGHEAFVQAFEAGDTLFGTKFNALDGVGVYVGNGQRFTRVPRMDMRKPGMWATHQPGRTTGPNAQSCLECHSQQVEDGAGGISANAVRDPLRKGRVDKFIERQTPALFGIGGVQRLAEEMTVELQATRSRAAAQVTATGRKVTLPLVAKGVSFGSISAYPASKGVKYDTSQVQGVAADLVVRPLQWKGSTTFIRQFVRNAANDELGMQATELVGKSKDADYDTVSNELTVGDVTAITIYQSQQPRPTTLGELARLGLAPALPATQTAGIAHGLELFIQAGCDECHRTSLTIDDPVFSEPSRNPAYRDATFPSGAAPVSEGLSPSSAITFDLTKDQQQNVIDLPNGSTFNLGAFVKNDEGQAVVELFGDLKRHDMGPGLAEYVDEVGTGPSTFMTRNLWGVGSTPPYMHDGRASTLSEAILDHGGEAQHQRDTFAALSASDRQDLVTFLNSLVLYKKQ